jgi:hypothetical protein
MEQNVSCIVIIGDFNADPRTYFGHCLTDMSNKLGLSAMIKEPTRIRENSSSILDQILINNQSFVTNISIDAPVSTNDHCTISLSLSFKVPRSKPYHRLMWLFKKADYDKFRQHLEKSGINLIDMNDNLDEIVSKWTKIFLDTAKLTIRTST